MISRLLLSRRLVLALLVLGLVSRPSAARETELPALEPWGDLRHPYADSLAAAAERALGIEGEPGTWLEEFFSLDMSTRESRERAARATYEIAFTLKKTTGIDSLELYFSALLSAPNTTPAYVQAVRILLERGSSRRAKPLLVQAIRLEPREMALWVLLGELYRQGGEDRKARTALEYALHLNGGSSHRTNAREALAVLYVRAGEFARADSLLHVAPGTAPPWLTDFIRAKAARQTGDVPAALEALRLATSRPEAPAAAFVELATLEQERGDLDAAEQAYSRALQLAPQENAAHTGLGLIQMARGDLEGAAARFAARVRADSADGTAQFNLGRVALQIAAASPARAESAYAKAEAAFAACIDANDNEANARLGRAQARWGRGDLDAAAADARALLASPAHTDRARLLLARVALTQGKPQEAADHLRPLADKEALDANGWAMLGKAYLEQGQAEPALAALEQARARSPGELHVDVNYAVALSQLGRLAEAETLLRQLAGAHPADSTVLQNLAAVLHRQGRDNEAEDLLEKIEKPR